MMLVKRGERDTRERDIKKRTLGKIMSRDLVKYSIHIVGKGNVETRILKVEG